MKPDLRDVTVCAADTVAPELAARALELCLDRAEFGDAILFSDRPVTGRFRTVAIPTMGSIGAYSRFCLAEMPRHIATDFALVVQWDGYIVHPEVWTDEFRAYDYIGAPFVMRGGDLLMGNGGFSWRSRKLLDAIPRLPFQRGVNEDMVICHFQRQHLETHFGIRYAPTALADRFAQDREHPPFPSFGFHGASNFLRYEDERTVLDIFERAGAGVFNTWAVFTLMLTAATEPRTRAAGVALYRLARRYQTENRLAKEMAKAMEFPLDRARHNVAVMEQYLRQQDAGVALP